MFQTIYGHFLLIGELPPPTRKLKGKEADSMLLKHFKKYIVACESLIEK